MPFIKPEPEEHKIPTPGAYENALSVKAEANQVKLESAEAMRGVRESLHFLSIVWLMTAVSSHSST